MATILSLTFNAVLPVSINASTEINISANATGKLSEESTIKAANITSSTTPAIPNELIPIIMTSGTIKLIVKRSDNMVKIYGKVVDDETRCEHYASEKDIIAIKFYCCGKYYPCYKCHQEAEDHSIQRWPKEEFDQQAILCGVCQTEQTIETYMNHNTCPECDSPFNENCRLHYPIYFEV